MKTILSLTYLLSFFFVSLPTLSLANSDSGDFRLVLPSQTADYNNENKWKPDVFDLDIKKLPPLYYGVHPEKFIDTFYQKNSPINTKDFYAFDMYDLGMLYFISPSSGLPKRPPIDEKMDSLHYNIRTQAYIGNQACFYWKIADYLKSYSNTNRWLTCSIHGLGFQDEGKTRIISSLEFNIINDRQVLNSIPHSKYESYVVLKPNISVPLQKKYQIEDKVIRTLIVGRITDKKLFRKSSYDETSDPFYSFYREIGIEKLNFIRLSVPFEVHRIIYYVLETGEILDTVDIRPRTS